VDSADFDQAVEMLGNRIRVQGGEASASSIGSGAGLISGRSQTKLHILTPR